MSTSRYAGAQGAFSLAIGKFVEQTKQDMTNVFRAVTIEIGSSIIKMSPVDTGRFRGEWQFTIDTPATSFTGIEDVSGAIATAALVDGAIQFQAGETAYITNILPYAIPLEYGHSDQAPSGMVRITMARIQQILAEAVQAQSRA